MRRGRSEWSEGLTCVPNQARSVLRRHFDADASGLNRPLNVNGSSQWEKPVIQLEVVMTYIRPTGTSLFRLDASAPI